MNRYFQRLVGLLPSALLLLSTFGCGSDLHVGVCRPVPGPGGPDYAAPNPECALVLEVDPFSCQSARCTEHSQECVLGPAEERLGKFCRDQDSGVECGICARSGSDIVCQASAQPILSALSISSECVESTECRPCRSPDFLAGEVFDSSIHDLPVCPENDDICNPAAGCFETYKAEGTPCAEAPCMEPGACNADGECIASTTPKDCDDQDPCTVDSCNPDTGECVNTPKECEGSTACHPLVCDPMSGECMGTPKDCSDDDLCTDDTCDEDTGDCLNTPKVCEDEDPCTENTCNPDTGACEFTSECDDGDPCTVDDCTDGCNSTPKVCDDGDPCTDDSCDPVSGDCIGTPIVCDDQDPCTDDICVDGQCTATPTVCDDQDPCTTDACDPMSGICEFVAIVCDDQNACTVDACVGGECTSTPKDCPAGEQCEAATCDPQTGECGVAPIASPIPSSSCCSPHEAAGCDTPTCESCVCEQFPFCCADDGTWDEFCVLATESAQCQDDCSQCDGAACCNVPQGNDFPFGGCSNEPCETCVCAIDSTCCDEDGWDQDCAAIANDQCGTTCTQCTGFIPCDDSNPCTVDDACTEGCSGTLKVCDDQNGCTDDTCAPDTGDCVFTPVVCDDTNPCTDDFCDEELGSCATTPKACPAGDQCEVGTCDPQTGECGSAPIPSPIPTSSCCEAHEGEGCDDPVCESCVCNAFPFCCDDEQGFWDEFCVLATEANCATECSQCNGAACCNTILGNDFPFGGCSNTPCETCVCELDPACCQEGGWTASCADLANEQCGTSCTQCTGFIPCDDGDLCTENDSCGEGCSGTLIDCNDGELCTIDSCDSVTGDCVTSPNPCDDSDPCTDDSCNPGEGGQCVNVEKVCNDSESCTTDSCDPTTGDCLFQPVESTVPTSSCCTAHGGSGCDNEVCESCICNLAPWCCDSQQGSGFWDEFCVGLTEASCLTECAQCNGAACCNVESGSDTPFSGCSNTVCETCVCLQQPSCCTGDWDESCSAIATSTICTLACTQCGVTCDDESICTFDDQCVAGECTGTPVACSAGSCEVGTCNEDTGLCDFEIDATLCDDNNVCTSEECLEGNCEYQTVIDCGDGNDCTSDDCDPVTGDCSNDNLTIDAVVKNSCCEAGGVGCETPSCESCVCALDDYCCNNEWDEYCVAQTELCPTECSVCDGEGCCQAGFLDEIGNFPTCSNLSCSACVGAEDEFCITSWDGICADIALTVCIDSCSQCSEGGEVCSDDDVCTVNDSCLDGECVGGGANPCDDSHPCTIDACIEGEGCVNTLDPEVACDDGDPCTDNLCGEGGCFNEPKDCDDGDPCTDDSCDAVTGDCLTPSKVSPAPTSTCCSPQEGSGCDDATCSACICALTDFAYCCTGSWDDDCVLATMNTACVDSCTVCEGAGCCNVPGGNDFPFSGCSQSSSCETCVCALDDTCCSGDWDDDCSTLAKTECLNECPACQEDPACDDGDFCTVGETCDGEGTCGNGAVKTCDDGIAVTFDICDVEAQICINSELD